MSIVNPLFVVKFNGEKEPFSIKKVYRSAKRVGASARLAKEIAEKIEERVYPGIKTSKIFREVKKMLQRERPQAALRFNLKEGMRKLGPSGFPFEKYIGEIFLRDNFEVKLNQHLDGYCLSGYEIDFLAKKNNLVYIGECKYRNLFEGKVHLEAALANYARFLDIEKGNYFGKKVRLKSLLVTNRKFTSQAVKYSQCVGVKLLGWNYPRGKGLEHLIESQKLYPITILPSLNKYLTEMFVSQKIMLAKDILEIEPERLSKRVKVPKSKLKTLKKEAEILFFK
jgi:hypothetical protein